MAGMEGDPVAQRSLWADRTTVTNADPIAALVEGRCRAPFDFLGNHPLRADGEGGRVVRVFLPWASHVRVLREGRNPDSMRRVHLEGVFVAEFPADLEYFAYRLEATDANGRVRVLEDPYRFPPFLDEGRAVLFLKGEERRVHEILGARPMRLNDVDGTGFAVWAPNARAVNLMGTMNRWEGRCHPMRPRGATGVWELFVPGVEKGAAYKYEIVTSSGRKVDKADPCGRAMELRPATASVVWDPTGFVWGDAEWRSASRSSPRRGADERLRGPPGIVEADSSRRARRAETTAGPRTGSWRRTSCPM